MVDSNRLVYEAQRQGGARILAIRATNTLQQAGPAARRVIKDELSRNLIKAMDLNLIPATRFERANQLIARRAQRAVSNGWKATLPAKSASYRRGPDPQKDRLSNLLGPALGSERMLQGTTARTISFINIGYLNSEARHWYRVNYGALGPKARVKRPKTFPVNVGGHTLFNLHDTARPAPNSWLPVRFQYNEEGHFQPLKGPANVHGGGHRAALFTDLGLRSVAKDFGPIYRAMFSYYVKEAGVRAGLRKKKVRVSVRSTANASLSRFS